MRLELRYAEAHASKRRLIDRLARRPRRSGDVGASVSARAEALDAHLRSEAIRAEAKAALLAADPRAKTNDTDYVFITFILRHLPHGVIGLLIAAFFAAALSSKAAELNALASTTTVDFYRYAVNRHAADAHYVAASKWFTIAWGLVAVAFALFANLAENLIQAVNIVGSIFYGVVLGCSSSRSSCGGSAAPPSSGRRWRPSRWSSSSTSPSTSATSGTT